MPIHMVLGNCYDKRVEKREEFMDFGLISHPHHSEDIDMVIDDKDMCLDYDQWVDTLGSLDSSFHHVEYSLWIQGEEDLHVLNVSFDYNNKVIINYNEEVTD